MNQLRQGIKVESEHKKTLMFIKKYFKRTGKMPKQTTIFKKIASDHLKEDPAYYTKLRKAKL